MYKILFIAVLLCLAESGFAKKKIDLNSQTKSPIPLFEVSIDEDLKELIFDFEDSQQYIRIILSDIVGNNICNVEISMTDIFVLPIPMIDKGKYVLHVFSKYEKLQGFFEIE